LSTTRIGLDARALTNINRHRGIGLYTARLIEKLLQEATDYEFVAFGSGEAPDADLLGPSITDRLEWRGLPEYRKLPYHDVLADHLALAGAVSRSGVAMFHGIDHNLSPFLKCPSLVTVHDLIPLIMPGPYLGPRQLLWSMAHRTATRRARLVVTVSESTRRDVARIWGIPEDRIRVVYEGVDQSTGRVEDNRLIEATTRKYGIRQPYFLFTGGFDPRKNIGNMLLAFKRFLLLSEKDFQFVLCGDEGKSRRYLHDQVAELGLDGRVVFPGFVPADDLPPIYSGATALVFVSLYEGFGLPPLESMMYQVPVLTSRVSSIPEVVGDAGLFVDPLEPGDIAAGMIRLSSDEELRKELVKNGMKRAALFTWEKAARETLSLYDQVLRGGGRD
jgi:glycosyltransferase involved in cell wall biosynthesis